MDFGDLADAHVNNAFVPPLDDWQAKSDEAKVSHQIRFLYQPAERHFLSLVILYLLQCPRQT